MSIVVYWSYLDKEWMKSKKPESIYKDLFFKKNNSESFSRMIKCPAIKDANKNLFKIFSVYDYEITIKNNQATSEYHNQDFFNSHVIVRDLSLGMISFSQPFIFFTEEKKLEITWQINPFLQKDSEVNYYLIPGKFDIGKWFRPLDFTFFIKNKEDSFLIKEDQPFSYLEFNTSEKIIFKKFIPTEKIYFYSNSCVMTNSGVFAKGKQMKQYYSYFFLKNKILKEIKNNIID